VKTVLNNLLKPKPSQNSSDCCLTQKEADASKKSACLSTSLSNSEFSVLADSTDLKSNESDSKILLEFVNKMLPIAAKNSFQASKIESAKLKKKAPVVHMNKTAQLRFEKSKIENKKNVLTCQTFRKHSRLINKQ
jgi:hypothetical protein